MIEEGLWERSYVYKKKMYWYVISFTNIKKCDEIADPVEPIHHSPQILKPTLKYQFFNKINKKWLLKRKKKPSNQKQSLKNLKAC